MSIRRALWLPLMALLVVLPCLAAARQAGHAGGGGASLRTARLGDAAPSEAAVATITFRKIFKSSSPEFVEIKVDKRGAGTYDIRQIADSPSPQPFQVSAALTAKIFSLAATLHDFSGVQLNARRLIANLGEKTFRFENNGETHQVSFNYTVNSTANQLLTIFEGLSLEDQYLDQLRRSMRYDPLGLDDVLTRLETDLESNAIAEPQALAPVLEQIVSNQRFLDIARDRARQILNSFGEAH
ncbi:MAG TPA: hypothetical protein VNJ52_12815 [Patescibacteria group bacterium]|nr:hypothetical protein [Patescibacteria group bacterium]